MAASEEEMLTEIPNWYWKLGGIMASKTNIFSASYIWKFKSLSMSTTTTLFTFAIPYCKVPNKRTNYDTQLWIIL